MLRTRRHPEAFTLIELLVTIAIIGLLVGLLIAAGAAMLRQGETEQTRVIVHEAGALLTEYQALTNRFPKYIGNYGNASESSRFFVEEIRKAGPVAEAFQGINRDFVVDPDPADMTDDYLIDAWGNPLRYSAYHDESTADPADDWYGDVTAGLPRRKTPYLASAGPDGIWGTFTADNEPDAEAADNLYSFEQSR